MRIFCLYTQSRGDSLEAAASISMSICEFQVTLFLLFVKHKVLLSSNYLANFAVIATVLRALFLYDRSNSSPTTFIELSSTSTSSNNYNYYFYRKSYAVHPICKVQETTVGNLPFITN